MRAPALLCLISALAACPGPGNDPDGGGPCAPVDPCAGKALSGPAPELLGGPEPALEVGDTRLILGQATRLEVQTSLGFGEADRGNDFRHNHCELGLQLQYVDDVDDDAYGGSPNGDDVLTRVVTLPDTEAKAGALLVGAPLDELRADFGADLVEAERGGTTLLTDPDTGRGALGGADGLIAQLFLAPPAGQGSVDGWRIPIGLDEGDFGELTTGESSIGDLEALLGPPAAVGVASSDLLLVDARVATWPAFGVRAAGACPVIGNCDEETRITSVLLSAPFWGEGEAGLGLASPKSAVDAHFDSSGTEVEGVVVYSGSTDVGFVYVEDESCEEHVGGIILDHRVRP